MLKPKHQARDRNRQNGPSFQRHDGAGDQAQRTKCGGLRVSHPGECGQRTSRHVLAVSSAQRSQRWYGMADQGRRVWWLERSDGELVRRWKRLGDRQAAERFISGLTPPGDAAPSTPSTAASNRHVFDAFLAAHVAEPEGTQRKYASTIQTWLAPALGELTGDDLNLSHYLTPLRAAMAAGRKRNTVAAVETALGAVATWAVAEGWWPPNPYGDERTRTAHVRELKRSTKRQDADARAQHIGDADGDTDRGVQLDHVPQWALIAELARSIEAREQLNPSRRRHGRAYGIDADAARQLGRSVELAAASGLRECELLGLHVSSIDVASGEIDVVRQLDRYKPWVDEGPPVRSPKYGKRRTAMVFSFYLDDLGELCEWSRANSHGWLFARTRAQRWWAEGWESSVRRGVSLMNERRAASRATTGGHAELWRWKRHYLRHWYGTHAVASPPAGGFGLSLALVATLMGHSSPAITSEIYLQETAGDRDHAREVTRARPE